MEIELYSRLNNPIEAIDKMGEWLAKGMMKAARVEQGKAAMLVAVCEKKNPVQVLRTYHFFEDGTFSKKALAALAEFRQAGGKHKWLRTGDEPAERAEDRFAEGEFCDKDANTMRYRYSMADAHAEGLIRANSRWAKRPGNMLRARVISNVLGMLMPELYAGSDAESEADTAPTQTLDLGQPQAQSQPETKTEPKTIIVQAEPVPPDNEKELGQMGLAPAPKPDHPPQTQQSNTTEEATEAEKKELAAKIAPFLAQALSFIRRSGLVPPDGDFDNLKGKQVRRILKNFESFKVGATGGVK